MWFFPMANFQKNRRFMEEEKLIKMSQVGSEMVNCEQFDLIKIAKAIYKG